MLEKCARKKAGTRSDFWRFRALGGGANHGCLDVAELMSFLQPNARKHVVNWCILGFRIADDPGISECDRSDEFFFSDANYHHLCSFPWKYFLTDAARFFRAYIAIFRPAIRKDLHSLKKTFKRDEEEVGRDCLGRRKKGDVLSTEVRCEMFLNFVPQFCFYFFSRN